MVSSERGNGIPHFLALYTFLMPFNVYLIRTLFYFFYSKNVTRSLIKAKEKPKADNSRVLKERVNKEVVEPEEKRLVQLLNPMPFSDCSRLDYSIFSANALSSGKYEVMGFTSSESFILTKSMSDYDPELIISDQTDQRIFASAGLFNPNTFYNHKNSVISEEKSLSNVTNYQINQIPPTSQPYDEHIINGSDLEIPSEKNENNSNTMINSSPRLRSTGRLESIEPLNTNNFTDYINQYKRTNLRMEEVEPTEAIADGVKSGGKLIFKIEII
jgi:hypothetical protein